MFNMEFANWKSDPNSFDSRKLYDGFNFSIMMNIRLTSLSSNVNIQFISMLVEVQFSSNNIFRIDMANEITKSLR